MPCMANDATTGATNAPPFTSLVKVSRLLSSTPSSAQLLFGSCAFTSQSWCLENGKWHRTPLDAREADSQWPDYLMYELDPGRAWAGWIDIPCMANDATTGATNALPLTNRDSVLRLFSSMP